MTKEFKYLEDKDQYLDFLIGFQDISTDKILADAEISKLYRRQIKEDGTLNAADRILKMAESFLFLHQDREDYELCQLIIDNYPELRTQVEAKEAFDNMFDGTTPDDMDWRIKNF